MDEINIDAGADVNVNVEVDINVARKNRKSEIIIDWQTDSLGLLGHVIWGKKLFS